MKNILESWDTQHTFAVALTVFMFLLGLIAFYCHKEEMTHIKMGHCLVHVRVVGHTHKQWENCK